MQENHAIVQTSNVSTSSSLASLGFPVVHTTLFPKPRGFGLAILPCIGESGLSGSVDAAPSPSSARRLADAGPDHNLRSGSINRNVEASPSADGLHRETCAGAAAQPVDDPCKRQCSRQSSRAQHVNAASCFARTKHSRGSNRSKVTFSGVPLERSRDGCPESLKPAHSERCAAPPAVLTKASLIAMENELGADFQSANAFSMVRLKRRVRPSRLLVMLLSCARTSRSSFWLYILVAPNSRVHSLCAIELSVMCRQCCSSELCSWSSAVSVCRFIGCVRFVGGVEWSFDMHCYQDDAEQCSTS